MRNLQIWKRLCYSETKKETHLKKEKETYVIYRTNNYYENINISYLLDKNILIVIKKNKICNNYCFKTKYVDLYIYSAMWT